MQHATRVHSGGFQWSHHCVFQQGYESSVFRKFPEIASFSNHKPHDCNEIFEHTTPPIQAIPETTRSRFYRLPVYLTDNYA